MISIAKDALLIVEILLNQARNHPSQSILLAFEYCYCLAELFQIFLLLIERIHKKRYASPVVLNTYMKQSKRHCIDNVHWAQACTNNSQRLKEIRN
jgi:hypothetical protein